MGPAKREKLLVRYNTLQQRYGMLPPGEVNPRDEIEKYGDLEEELVDPGVADRAPEGFSVK